MSGQRNFVNQTDLENHIAWLVQQYKHCKINIAMEDGPVDTAAGRSVFAGPETGVWAVPVDAEARRLYHDNYSSDAPLYVRLCNQVGSDWGNLGLGWGALVVCKTRFNIRPLCRACDQNEPELVADRKLLSAFMLAADRKLIDDLGLSQEKEES